MQGFGPGFGGSKVTPRVQITEGKLQGGDVALFGSHGFPIWSLNTSNLKTYNAFATLTGNAMSIPVVGAVLLSVLCTLDFGSDLQHFRIAASLFQVPGPVRTFNIQDHESDSDLDEESTSSSS